MMKRIFALSFLLLSTAAFGDPVNISAGLGPVPSLPLVGGALTGPITFADGSIWSLTGLSSSASYTTSSSAFINLTPTWNYSGTGIVSALSYSPTLTPTGASSSELRGMFIDPIIGNSAVNVATARGLAIELDTAANYSGTVTTANTLSILSPITAGTNPYTNYRHISIGNLTNGNGITSGTVNNYDIFTSGGLVTAGAGGTVNNYAVDITVTAGSGAGTTNNYGLYITGNGGSGGAGTTNNYAIDSVSTAPSFLSGTLSLATGSAANPELYFSTDVGSGLYRPAVNQVGFATNGLAAGLIDATQHVRLGGSSSPTIANNACGSTTQGTVAAGSSDRSGIVSVGTALVTSCAVSFASAYTTAPRACVISPANSAGAAFNTVQAYTAAPTTSGFTITGLALASTAFNYHCE